ncbi:MAG: hypothetical protein IJO43_03645 [Bacilli bacterium]|nr:hypothetical protein [Bacilli bacterium]
MKKLDWKLFLIFGGILFLAIFSFGFGYDYYWHVKAGEYMISNLKIPYHDVFSWYGISKNLYWMSHEWLSEVVIYGYKYIFKDLGPILFNITVYSILILSLFICNKEKLAKNKIFTFIWSLIGVMTFSRVMLPRPHMISYVLLALTIHVLYDNFNNKNSKKIYWLPFISMLWSNFHGGSSNLPYILCFMFLIAGLFKFKFGKIEANRINNNQIKKYLICGLLSILFIAINPHGLKMLTYPYINMGDTLMISNITEWASPSLSNMSDIGDFILLGIVILAMIITKKKIKFIDFIVAGAFLVLGFKSLKFISLLYIASTFIVFNFIDEYKFKIPNIMAVSILVSIIIGFVISTPKLIDKYNKKLIPDEIISYIKEKEPKKLYNYYGFGGYLIYNDIPVFIDGRADMYSKYNFKDALDIQHYGYSYLLKGYDFDMFIIPNNLSLNIHLSTNSNYVLTIQKENVVIYEKSQQSTSSNS